MISVRFVVGLPDEDCRVALLIYLLGKLQIVLGDIGF